MKIVGEIQDDAERIESELTSFKTSGCRKTKEAEELDKKGRKNRKRKLLEEFSIAKKDKSKSKNSTIKKVRKIKITSFPSRLKSIFRFSAKFCTSIFFRFNEMKKLLPGR